jgi:hypothetical protein
MLSYMTTSWKSIPWGFVFSDARTVLDSAGGAECFNVAKYKDAAVSCLLTEGTTGGRIQTAKKYM